MKASVTEMGENSRIWGNSVTLFSLYLFSLFTSILKQVVVLSFYNSDINFPRQIKIFRQKKRVNLGKKLLHK